MRTPTRLFIRTAALVLLCALFDSAPALAQLQLRWNDCYGLSSSAVNQDYACNGTRPGAPFQLVMSFTSPATLPQFVGVIAYLDITSLPTDNADPAHYPLPDFWRMAPGECRAGNVLFPRSFAGIGTGATGTCPNPWLGATSIGTAFEVFTEQISFGPPWPGHERLKLAIVRNSPPTQLTAGQQYLIGAVGLDMWKDIGPDACDGCCVPMRVRFDSLEVYQISGSPPQETYWLHPPVTAQAEVHWQQGAICNAVPVRRSTWGSIKATYR